MRGIYNYIHETNHISKVHSVAAILQLHFMLYVMLCLKGNVLYILFLPKCVRSAQ